MVGLAAVPWLDRLLRQAGRPDLVQFTPGTVWPAIGMVSGATVGAVLASRRPRHPAGWRLLALGLSLVATAAAAQYLTWGLLVRPGALPAARLVALSYPATGFTALALVGLVLLLTPTGSLASRRWRWWARGMVAAPVGLLLVATVSGGPLDPRYQALGGPFDLRGLGGLLLVGNQLALAVTTLAVVVAAGSLVGRFRRARGTERLQLRWVALAAALVALAGVVVLAALALGVPGATTLLSGAAGFCIAVLPVATGAAILRAVDRRFNRRRYDAAQTIAAFSARLREEIDLDTLTAELLGVVGQTMQPTGASLWLRPSGGTSANRRGTGAGVGRR
jgi:hypothetical protein